MEYNPAIKRDELLIYTTKLNLKNIVLSAASLKQRVHTMWFHYYKIYFIILLYKIFLYNNFLLFLFVFYYIYLFLNNFITKITYYVIPLL